MVTWQLDPVYIQKMSVSVHSNLTIACYPLTMHIHNHNTYFQYLLLLYLALILKNKAYILVLYF